MSQYVDHSETVDSKIPRSHIRIRIRIRLGTSTSTRPRACAACTRGSRLGTAVALLCYVLARVGSFFCLCHGFVRAGYRPCKFIFRKRRMLTWSP